MHSRKLRSKIAIQKVDLQVFFFTRFTHVKRPQINFSPYNYLDNLGKFDSEKLHFFYPNCPTVLCRPLLTLLFLLATDIYFEV